MIRHYLRVALRNLSKNKKFSAINIIGLTIGLTCCLLIALYIQNELNYDDFQEKGDRTVRVIEEYKMGDFTNAGNFTSTKVAPTFKRNFAEIEEAVRMTYPGSIVSYQDKLFTEKYFIYADSTFFNVFTFPLIKGNPATALNGPNVVTVTESAAKKYFGYEDPIGKTIKVGPQAKDFVVTGILKDCPVNSHIKFDFVASFSSLNANQERTYSDANYITYFLMKDKAAIASLQSKIPAFMKKETADQMAEGDFINFVLEPLKTVHLYSSYAGYEPNNSITYIYIVAAVALLILIIASFTYINLCTARSMERAKEVGIRKVAGAFRKQIFWQFIGESVFVTLISLILSVCVTALLIPAFNVLAERNLSVVSLFSPATIGFALFVVVSISLLAGSYPAFILSKFQPVKVLKGAFKNTGSGLMLRKSLIVFQFVISAFLIVATFIIQNQLHYIQNKKLGFDRDHLVSLPLDQKIMDKITTIKAELKSNPDIISIAKSHNRPINIQSGYSMRTETMPENKDISVTANVVDEDFVKTIGLQLIAGSDLTSQDVKDAVNPDETQRKFHYILNESAVKALGWTVETAVGKKMFLGDQRPGIVKGVVKDFHFASLHEPIKPLVLFNDFWGNNLIVKVSGERMQQTLAFMESKWKTFAPHRPFEYRFMDEEYNKLYSSEMRLGKILNIFAVIAVLLAALGLFGLSAFTIQQRTKEIGIRKVLGASSGNIALLLSNQFIKLVLIALVIASPVAWLVMNKWLQDFTYRVNISWWMFALSGAMAIFIAVLTVSFGAVKAAVANPVKSLRTE